MISARGELDHVAPVTRTYCWIVGYFYLQAKALDKKK